MAQLLDTDDVFKCENVLGMNVFGMSWECLGNVSVPVAIVRLLKFSLTVLCR